MNQDTEQGTKLLPCPFCDNALSRKITMRVTGLKVRRDDVAYLGNAPWIVLCLDCGANGANKSSKAEAIAAWNTREHGAAEKLVEALTCDGNPVRAYTLLDWCADRFALIADGSIGEGQWKNSQWVVDMLRAKGAIARAALSLIAEGTK